MSFGEDFVVDQWLVVARLKDLFIGCFDIDAKGGLEHRNYPIDISMKNKSNKGKIPSPPKIEIE